MQCFSICKDTIKRKEKCFIEQNVSGSAVEVLKQEKVSETSFHFKCSIKNGKQECVNQLRRVSCLKILITIIKG